jgi:GcrA cell cycle regulator
MTTMAWTDDRIERLKALFADGKSATDISLEFRVTRNVVCGKLSRLGLFRNHEPTAKPRILRPRISRVNSNSTAVRLSTAHEPAGFANLRIVDVVSRNVSLIDLKPNDCRYPDGDPPAFCGHPKLKDFSYCASHHALCTAPPWRQ